MDLFNVIIIIPSTGNRMVLEGIEAEVDFVDNSIDLSSTFDDKPIIMPTGSSYLDIIFSIYNPSSNQYGIIKQTLINEQFLLHFEDVHPCLIKCILKGITQDQQKITIKLKGNTTDIEYLDYITEVTNQFNAKIEHIQSNIDHGSSDPKLNPFAAIPKKEFDVDGFPDLTQPNDPIDNGIVYPLETEKEYHFRKHKERKESIKVLKRKLTF